MAVRHGRAFTHDVRARFPSAETSLARSSASPSSSSTHNGFCHYPPCLAQSIPDSSGHQLITCPRHTIIRNQLFLAWRSHPFGKPLLCTMNDLTLRLVLGESPVPYNASKKNCFQSWYQHLSDFILNLYKNIPSTPLFPKPL